MAGAESWGQNLKSMVPKGQQAQERKEGNKVQGAQALPPSPPGQTEASLISPALPPACPCLPGAPPTPSLLHSQICCPNQACGQSSSSWLGLTFPGVLPATALKAPQSHSGSSLLQIYLSASVPAAPRAPDVPRSTSSFQIQQRVLLHHGACLAFPFPLVATSPPLKSLSFLPVPSL